MEVKEDCPTGERDEKFQRTDEEKERSLFYGRERRRNKKERKRRKIKKKDGREVLQTREENEQIEQL